MHDDGQNNIDYDALLRSRDYDTLNASLWNDKCNYMEVGKCNNLNPNNYNLIVMQLNIRSALGHQQELCQLLRSTENKNSWIDVILLCETFLSSKTKSMVDIPGFYIYVTIIRLKREGECQYYSVMELPTSRDQILTYLKKGLLNLSS